jgi:hypothetical protein
MNLLQQVETDDWNFKAAVLINHSSGTSFQALTFATSVDYVRVENLSGKRIVQFKFQHGSSPSSSPTKISISDGIVSGQTSTNRELNFGTASTSAVTKIALDQISKSKIENLTTLAKTLKSRKGESPWQWPETPMILDTSSIQLGDLGLLHFPVCNRDEVLANIVKMLLSNIDIFMKSLSSESLASGNQHKGLQPILLFGSSGSGKTKLFTYLVRFLLDYLASKEQQQSPSTSSSSSSSSSSSPFSSSLPLSSSSTSSPSPSTSISHLLGLLKQCQQVRLSLAVHPTQLPSLAKYLLENYIESRPHSNSTLWTLPSENITCHKVWQFICDVEGYTYEKPGLVFVLVDEVNVLTFLESQNLSSSFRDIYAYPAGTPRAPLIPIFLACGTSQHIIEHDSGLQKFCPNGILTLPLLTAVDYERILRVSLGLGDDWKPQPGLKKILEDIEGPARLLETMLYHLGGLKHDNLHRFASCSKSALRNAILTINDNECEAKYGTIRNDIGCGRWCEMTSLQTIGALPQFVAEALILLSAFKIPVKTSEFLANSTSTVESLIKDGAVVVDKLIRQGNADNDISKVLLHLPTMYISYHFKTNAALRKKTLTLFQSPNRASHFKLVSSDDNEVNDINVLCHRVRAFQLSASKVCTLKELIFGLSSDHAFADVKVKLGLDRIEVVRESSKVESGNFNYRLSTHTPKNKDSVTVYPHANINAPYASFADSWMVFELDESFDWQSFVKKNFAANQTQQRFYSSKKPCVTHLVVLLQSKLRTSRNTVTAPLPSMKSEFDKCVGILDGILFLLILIGDASADVALKTLPENEAPFCAYIKHSDWVGPALVRLRERDWDLNDE